MSLTLANYTKTDYVIVTPKNPPAPTAHAAEELARFLSEISGALFPVRTEDEPASAHEILVGKSGRVPELDLSRCGREGFILRTGGEKLILAGNTPRGTLYAVYAFLENVLGCRWFTAEVSRIPKRLVLCVPELDCTETPALEYREPFALEAYDADWAARNRCNSSASRLDEKRGGKVVYDHFVHTFAYLVPVETYFDEHPEYFSEVNGVRTKDHTQLCLTNPDVLRIAVETVKGWLRANPRANIVSVSQNDWRNPCTCANCRAVDEAEGGHAGTLLRFVNAVAEEIEKEFPDVAIDTLAYQYTRPAPRITRPRHNVIVRLCSIECCFTHPLGTCDHFREATDPSRNNTFLTDLEDWSKICDRLYIWDYVTNFHNYLYPHPNTDILGDNVRFFAAHSVKGIFEQGSYQSPGGYCAELKAYILAKALWDPSYDEVLAADEFFAGVYRGAAPVMKRIFASYRRQLLSEGYHLTFSVKVDSLYRDADFVRRIAAMFDEAERAAEDEAVLRQVKKARLWQRYLELTHVPEGTPGRDELFDRFAEDCKAYGINKLNEWEPIDTAIANWKAGKRY